GRKRRRDVGRNFELGECVVASELHIRRSGRVGGGGDCRRPRRALHRDQRVRVEAPVERPYEKEDVPRQEERHFESASSATTGSPWLGHIKPLYLSNSKPAGEQYIDG